MKQKQIKAILQKVYDREMKKRDFDIQWYEDKKQESTYDFERERFNIHLNAALLAKVVTSDLVQTIKDDLGVV